MTRPATRESTGSAPRSIPPKVGADSCSVGLSATLDFGVAEFCLGASVGTGSSGAMILEPHRLQKMASSGNSAPHCGQYMDARLFKGEGFHELVPGCWVRFLGCHQGEIQSVAIFHRCSANHVETGCITCSLENEVLGEVPIAGGNRGIAH